MLLREIKVRKGIRQHRIEGVRGHGQSFRKNKTGNQCNGPAQKKKIMSHRFSILWLISFTYIMYTPYSFC